MTLYVSVFVYRQPKGTCRMLWPSPRRLDRVELTCTCRATVLWFVPVIFLYCCRIDQKGNNCQTHKSGRRVVKFLETIKRQL